MDANGKEPGKAMGELAAAVAGLQQHQTRLADLAMSAATLESYLDIDKGLGDDEDQAWNQFRSCLFALISTALGHERAAPAFFHLFGTGETPYVGSYRNIDEMMTRLELLSIRLQMIHKRWYIFYEKDGQFHLLARRDADADDWTMLDIHPYQGPYEAFGAIACQDTHVLFAPNEDGLFELKSCHPSRAEAAQAVACENGRKAYLFQVDYDGTMKRVSFARELK